MANIGGMDIFDGGQFAWKPREDVYISYLPLAHVFERFMYIACLSNGV